MLASGGRVGGRGGRGSSRETGQASVRCSPVLALQTPNLGYTCSSQERPCTHGTLNRDLASQGQIVSAPRHPALQGSASQCSQQQWDRTGADREGSQAAALPGGGREVRSSGWCCVVGFHGYSPRAQGPYMTGAVAKPGQVFRGTVLGSGDLSGTPGHLKHSCTSSPSPCCRHAGRSRVVFSGSNINLHLWIRGEHLRRAQLQHGLSPTYCLLLFPHSHRDAQGIPTKQGACRSL